MKGIHVSKEEIFWTISLNDDFYTTYDYTLIYLRKDGSKPVIINTNDKNSIIYEKYFECYNLPIKISKIISIPNTVDSVVFIDNKDKDEIKFSGNVLIDVETEDDKVSIEKPLDILTNYFL